MEKKCCICRKEFVGYGNSALPIKDGICCDYCNFKYVISASARLCKTNNPKSISYEIVNEVQKYIDLTYKLNKSNFSEKEVSIQEGVVIYKNPETEEEVDVIMALEVKL